MSKKGCVIISIVAIIIILLICSCCAVFGIISASTSSSLYSEPSELSESVIYTGGTDKIVVIPVEGTIIDAETSSDFWGSTIAGSRTIIQQLDLAIDDSNVKAIVLDINSPGGDAYAAEQIHNKLVEVKASEKKIVTIMRGMAASGGYYVAAPSDVIIADDMTITGSIGVVMQLQSLEGLYEKLGIETRTITNSEGDYKTGEGLFDDDPNGVEDQIFQELVDETYNRFVEVVANGREMTTEEVKELADGRIYSGSQALELNLVDKIGTYDDAIKTAETEAGISDATIIEYKSTGFWDMLYGYASNFTTPLANFTKYYDVGEGARIMYILDTNASN